METFLTGQLGRGFRDGMLKIVEGCYRYREASLCAYSKARTFSARVVLVSKVVAECVYAGWQWAVCMSRLYGASLRVLRCAKGERERWKRGKDWMVWLGWDDWGWWMQYKVGW